MVASTRSERTPCRMRLAMPSRTSGASTMPIATNGLLAIRRRLVMLLLRLLVLGGHRRKQNRAGCPLRSELPRRARGHSGRHRVRVNHQDDTGLLRLGGWNWHAEL